MIQMNIGIKSAISKTIGRIDNAIGLGMNDGAKGVAHGMKDKARKILEPHNKSGNLSAAIDAIDVKSGDLGLSGFARWDFIVDERKAPHAVWINVGKLAGSKLPWSKSGIRDYSKSGFTGYHYIDKAFKAYSESNLAESIVAQAIKIRLAVIK